MEFNARLGGFIEALVGSALMTTAWWGSALDRAIEGAHAVAAFGGALIALHGVWRIIQRHTTRRRRMED